jgi:predicted NAD-dependent protein-ADP-ribosyltransferase YbiA (DUF1768 family)
MSVPPVFIKSSDIDTTVTPFEMCNIIIRAIGSGSKLDGVQKVNNLWRIYLKDRTTRLQLFNRGKVLINGHNISLYDQNPYISKQTSEDDPTQQPQPNDKLTIKHLALSVSNEEIKKMLEEKNINLKSKVRYGYIRDVDGHLTDYRSGDRFVYVEPFHPPLSRDQKIGNFSCAIIHHGKDQPCISCNMLGHKIGASTCKAKPTREITAFRGYTHPLSNDFPCNIVAYDNEFKSLNHAYLWYMATDLEQHDLAIQIKDSVHAGAAMTLSKSIADDDTRWEWEMNNVHVMKELLEIKANQCAQFKRCLLENKDNTVAHAIPSKLWGTGLSIYVTQNTDGAFWPGQNLLGALLMELTQELPTSDDEPLLSDDDPQVEEEDTLPVHSVADGKPNQEQAADPSDELLISDDDPQVEEKQNLPVHSKTSQKQHQAQAQGHTSRSRDRKSPNKRPQRITSTPGNKGNKTTKRDKQITKQTNKSNSRTPQLNIKKMFLDAKRKAMETSPEESAHAQGPRQRTLNAATSDDPEAT